MTTSAEPETESERATLVILNAPTGAETIYVPAWHPASSRAWLDRLVMRAEAHGLDPTDATMFAVPGRFVGQQGFVPDEFPVRWIRDESPAL